MDDPQGRSELRILAVVSRKHQTKKLCALRYIQYSAVQGTLPILLAYVDNMIRNPANLLAII